MEPGDISQALQWIEAAAKQGHADAAALLQKIGPAACSTGFERVG